MAITVEQERLLTVREVGQLLHIHENTVRRWSNQGMIRAYRIGLRGDRRFSAKDVSEYLDQFRQP